MTFNNAITCSIFVHVALWGLFLYPAGRHVPRMPESQRVFAVDLCPAVPLSRTDPTENTSGGPISSATDFEEPLPDVPKGETPDRDLISETGPSAKTVPEPSGDGAGAVAGAAMNRAFVNGLGIQGMAARSRQYVRLTEASLKGVVGVAISADRAGDLEGASGTVTIGFGPAGSIESVRSDGENALTFAMESAIREGGVDEPRKFMLPYRTLVGKVTVQKGVPVVSLNLR